MTENNKENLLKLKKQLLTKLEGKLPRQRLRENLFI